MAVFTIQAKTRKSPKASSSVHQSGSSIQRTRLHDKNAERPTATKPPKKSEGKPDWLCLRELQGASADEATN